MALVYSEVNFNNRRTRETGNGEPSQSLEGKENVTYSTLKFPMQAAAKKKDVTNSSVSDPKKAGQARPEDPVDSSPKPGSKVVMAGWGKERLLWISLCTLLFAVAFVVGVLYISGQNSHKEIIAGTDQIIKQLQTNLSSSLQEREKLIQQLQTEKDKQTCDPQPPCVGDACCAEGWKYFSGRCYYFSTEEKTWTESRDACVAAGGDLVIISSTEEQDLKKLYPGPGEQQYWVGLTDAVKEGDWRWLDGTRLSETSKYWNGREPDNWKGEMNQYPEGEDCAEMLLSTKAYLLWDAFCDDQQTKKQYVCETKAPKRIKQRNYS